MEVSLFDNGVLEALGQAYGGGQVSAAPAGVGPDVVGQLLQHLPADHPPAAQVQRAETTTVAREGRHGLRVGHHTEQAVEEVTRGSW